MPDLIKRREAKALGLPRYFTGKRCPNGHIAERYTCGTGCVECAHRYRASKGHRYESAEAAGRRRDGLRQLQARRGGYTPPARPEAECPPKPALCECCREQPAERLDHCHASGLFRGWICNSCNIGIGFLGDDLPGLLKAVEYLKRSVR